MSDLNAIIHDLLSSLNPREQSPLARLWLRFPLP
jgi:hypothetical protein